MSPKIKTILVPFGSHERAGHALAAALAISRRFDACIEALHVRPSPHDVLRHPNIIVPNSTRKVLLQTAESGAKDTAARARQAFEDACRRETVPIVKAPAGGPCARWHEEVGQEADFVTYRGRLADLIVLPRPERDNPPAATVEAALMETGRAVMLVPPTDGAAIGEVCAIGWNGSKEAAAAIAAAMPFLANAREAVVLAREDWNKPSPPPAEVVDYLARHGVNAAARGFRTGNRTVADTLMEECRAAGADMLVIGGYGHSRTREMVFGGVTRHLLAHAELPVLMAH